VSVSCLHLWLLEEIINGAGAGKQQIASNTLSPDLKFQQRRLSLKSKVKIHTKISRYKTGSSGVVQHIISPLLSHTWCT